MLEFAIKDCALAIIATGRRAQTLRELRNVMRDVHPGSIYHHFWGTLLRPQPSDREYNNDFATWCHQSLHDAPAAERLAVIDPADFSDMEDLRQELIEVIDERLDETELMLFTRADQQFHFARSIIVVFDTHRVLAHPARACSTRCRRCRWAASSTTSSMRDAGSPSGGTTSRPGLPDVGPEYSASDRRYRAAIDPYFESLFVSATG